MKYLITSILMLFLVQPSNSQDNPNLSVTVESGVFIREEPDMNSTALCSALFMEEVEELESLPLTDTINGQVGSWFRVKKGNCTGYVFSAYLTNQYYKHNPKFPTDYPQIGQEDLNMWCGSQSYYNPELNWHGLYYDQQEKHYSIRPVSTSLQKREYYMQVSLHTDQKDTSLFLIGLPLELSSQEYYEIIPKIDYGNYLYRFFFPGQRVQLCQNENLDYYLHAAGQVAANPTGWCQKIEDYELRITAIDQRSEEIVKSQNLLENQAFWNDCERPEVLFAGDLDNDQIPDLILQTHEQSTISLWLSSYAEGEEILKKVATYVVSDCC